MVPRLVIIVVPLVLAGIFQFAQPAFGFQMRRRRSGSHWSLQHSIKNNETSNNHHDHPMIAPEITSELREKVKVMLNDVFGKDKSNESEERRRQARNSSKTLLEQGILREQDLVYGELGLDALITILDAVGVQPKDRFLDIGSGDGMLVMAASMLYPKYLDASMGIEIVPELYQRSLQFQTRLQQRLTTHNNNKNGEEDDISLFCPTKISLEMGNIYEPSRQIQEMVSKTTLAICFATTWSRGIPGKKLSKLSQSLGTNGICELPSGARLVILDGVLNHEQDGFDYGGQFKLYCPDTAPYSTARLYVKL